MRSSTKSLVTGSLPQTRYVLKLTCYSTTLIFIRNTIRPLQALQHPLFQEMIHVAARATNGVKIDNLRNTREGILREFQLFA